MATTVHNSPQHTALRTEHTVVCTAQLCYTALCMPGLAFLNLTQGKTLIGSD